MKKIIAVLLLSVLLVLSFSACQKHECTFADEWTYDAESHWHAATCQHTDKKIDVAKHTFVNNVCVCGAKNLQKFTDAIKNANPMSARVTLTEDTQLDGIVLNGLYSATYLDNGSVRVLYEVEKFDDTFTSADPVVKVEGMVTVNADGTVSGESGLNKGVHIAILLNLDLTNPNLNVTVSDETLRFTVAAADTAAVLGIAVDSDVTVGLNVVDGKVHSIDVTYSNTTITALYF